MYCWLDWFLGNLAMFDYIIIGGGSAGCVLAADWRYADVCPTSKKPKTTNGVHPARKCAPSHRAYSKACRVRRYKAWKPKKLQFKG
jgi:pyruvate/2-oxoglutarate dehydrogenase complex dihydrolipoamide dehydrogenase (E3) component